MDDLEEGVILKAATMFGGKPYYDVVLSVLRDPENNVTGGGSFTLPGIPAGRSYVVFFDVYAVGDQDKDDADIVAYSRVWQSDPDPYQQMFEATNDGFVLSRLATELNLEDSDVGAWARAEAESVFRDVRDEFGGTVTHEVIRSPIVEAGKTVTIELEVIPEPSPEPDGT